MIMFFVHLLPPIPRLCSVALLAAQRFPSFITLLRYVLTTIPSPVLKQNKHIVRVIVEYCGGLTDRSIFYLATICPQPALAHYETLDLHEIPCAQTHTHTMTHDDTREKGKQERIAVNDGLCCVHRIYGTSPHRTTKHAKAQTRRPLP